jgi:hypothetical protein
MDVIGVLELVVFGWLTIYAMICVRCISQGRRESLLFVGLAHYAAFALPLLADVVFGPPSYLSQPGLHYACTDPFTRVLYCVCVAVVPLLWIPLLRRCEGDSTLQPALDLGRPRILLGAMVLSLPVIVAAFGPNPESYLTYGALPLTDSGSEIAAYHTVVSALSILAVVAAVGILSHVRNLAQGFFYVAPWWLAAVWLNGKRAAVALSVLMGLLLLWQRGAVHPRRFKMLLGVGVVAVLAYSALYQTFVRGAIQPSAADTYDNLRLDFFRDSRLKLILHSELGARAPVLDYRGETLVFYLTCMVPRSVWPDKPFPYGTYLTAAALDVAPRDLGWTITSSVVDESVANLSWAGLLLAPLLIGVVCTVGDSARTSFTSAVTAVTGSLLLFVQATAFLPLIVTWIALVVSARRRQRRLVQCRPANGFYSAEAVQRY